MVDKTTSASAARSSFHPALAVSNIKNHIPIMLEMENVQYTTWAELFKIHAKSHREIDHIIPSEKTTSPTTNVDKELWLTLDATVLQWIYCTISNDLLHKIIKPDASAKEVWNRLRDIFQDNKNAGVVIEKDIFQDNKNAEKDKDHMAEYIPLDRAIMSGNWEEANQIFNKDEDALTAKIDIDENSPLHIAVGTRNLEFVKELLKKLKEIKPKVLSTMLSKSNWSALHSAALVGNMEAARMLVNEEPRLLFTIDNINGHLPIHKAIINFHIKTFEYLLQVSEEKIDLSREDVLLYKSPFDGVEGVLLLTNVIHAGELHVAHELITKFPRMAITKIKKDHGIIISPLTSIASKADAYLSGKQYNFYQRFLSSALKGKKERKGRDSQIDIPIKTKGTDVPDTSEDVENQERDTTKCRRSYFYPAIQEINAKFWKLALHVPHVKKIRQDIEKHDAAIFLLKCICKKVGELKEASDIFEHYADGFNLAVENDTHEAIKAIIRHFPQATWTMSEGYKLSQNAIINRCEKVYDFSVKQVVNNHMLRTCIDEEGNNLLHLAGKLAPIHKLNKVTGAALQMQRELQWFEEVKKFVLPGDIEGKNNSGCTPMMLFRETHKNLRKEGEEWMKKAADSYTITAALIITIAFAAAITVPGGNNSDTGKAIFETKSSFIVFVVSDAISLFTSSTSLLMFLSVLTARYREEDFLTSLPKRLILGLVMLFLSMTSMIVAFSAALYISFGQGKAWILIPIGALTCLPIASFMKLQFPLLAELIQSTCGHGIFSKKSKGHLIWSIEG